MCGGVKLDYCNSILSGSPTSTLNVLQKVQNAAACATRLSAETSRPRRQFSSTVALATHTVTCVVQAVHDTDVQSQLRPRSKIHQRPCQYCRCNGNTTWFAIWKTMNYCLPSSGRSSESEPFRTLDQQPGNTST